MHDLKEPIGDADRVVGVQPGEHAGDERRVVLAAEAVKVQAPLGDGVGLGGGRHAILCWLRCCRGAHALDMQRSCCIRNR